MVPYSNGVEHGFEKNVFSHVASWAMNKKVVELVETAEDKQRKATTHN